MKAAYAILRNGKIFLQSYSKATTGLWIATGPVHVVGGDCEAELSERIRGVLAGSEVDVPHPSQSEWKLIQAPMLQAVGVKSWATLGKGAKSVGLECESELVRMVPTSDYWNKGGRALKDQTIECELSSAELGHKLVTAFEACS
ncbi:hypothetical protein [Paraburkholderia tropica]|uniref:hypothetical protein n=1 Tax=Paraburkholderia tropica TaxID=92647 RepID=UPI0012EAB5D4|nr:hypothetical protein [Paraburkholderia tropica]MBB2980294.1 hypothetical protein [Paraburkholderia tropica]